MEGAWLTPYASRRSDGCFQKQSCPSLSCPLEPPDWPWWPCSPTHTHTGHYHDRETHQHYWSYTTYLHNQPKILHIEPFCLYQFCQHISDRNTNKFLFVCGTTNRGCSTVCKKNSLTPTSSSPGRRFSPRRCPLRPTTVHLSHQTAQHSCLGGCSCWVFGSKHTMETIVEMVRWRLWADNTPCAYYIPVYFWGPILE